MTLWQAIVLGIVEGVTEFLPVSSTAHILLTSRLLGVPTDDFLTSFGIIVQLGAILAVVTLYVRRVLGNIRLLIPVIIGFIPTMVIGYILYDMIKAVLLQDVRFTIGGLLIGGLFLVITEYISRSRQVTVQLIEDVPPLKAFWVGVGQSLAAIPGMSRSAMTIGVGKLLGLSRETAVEFSFLLATPVMLAATVLDIYESYDILRGSNWGLIAVGFVTAFIVALISIRWLIQFAQHHSLAIFGWYRIGLAVLLLIFLSR